MAARPPQPRAASESPSSAPSVSAPERSRRLVASAVVSVVLALVSLALLQPNSLPGSRLVRASYDLSFRLRPSPDIGNASTCPVLLAVLDRRTFETLGLDPAEPLDRAVHARLIRRLADAQVHLVLVDILFQQPGPHPDSDTALADALRTHGNVLLGAEWHRSDLARSGDLQVAIRGVGLPISNLLAAAAGHGFVFSRVDPDFVVRRHFPGFLDRGLPSLTWVAAQRLNLEVTRRASPREVPRWMNYYGPPMTVPAISYVDLLDPQATPDALLRGKIVLLGTRPTAGRFDERRDEWRSPYSGWGQGTPFMPAVEVHATELLNLLRGDWLRRLPPALEAGVACLSAGLLSFLCLRLRPVQAALTALGSAIAVLLAAGCLMTWHHLWFPWLIIGAVQIPAAATASFLHHSLAWYRQRRRFLSRLHEQATLLDKAQDAIFVVAGDGTITYANPKARSLYGWRDIHVAADAAASSLGWDFQELIAHARRMAQVHGEWSGEWNQQNAQGLPIVVETRASLILKAPGAPPEILFINTDITERKRIQDQFLRAQRREGVGALAGGMAHDLNNALSPVLMGIQMLRARSQDDATRRILAVVESNTQRGAGMIRQVLLFSRGQDTTVGPVPLHPLLRELEGVLRHSFPSAIDLQVLAPPDLWVVQANPTQLQQILLNLCLNARDAMPQGGRLTLAADNADLTPDDLHDLPGLAPGRHVMLLVSDTGTGMTPEVQARLFEPFFTTKPAGLGTGLGLATVASLVKSHGGALRVRSQCGEGTTFEIYFPAPAPALSAITPAPAPGALPESLAGHGEEILVADDDLSVRDLLVEGLGSQGFTTLAAGSGVEAMAFVRRHSKTLRLAIIDARLSPAPGRSLASGLQHEFPDLPLIVIRGAAADTHDSDHLDGPKVVVLERPFRWDELLAAVGRQLTTAP